MGLPAEEQSGHEAAQAVGLYREHVRSMFGVELLHLRSDSDLSFAVSGHGEARVESALRQSLAASPPIVQLSFSPPYCQAMNPVENSVRQAYYLMNFFLARAHLPMLAWLVRHAAGRSVRVELVAAPAISESLAAHRLPARACHRFET